MEIENLGPATWAYAFDQATGRIFTAQHFCGANGHVVNARLDDTDNWYCPRCNEVYAAADQREFLLLKNWLKSPAEPPTPEEIQALINEIKV